MKLGIIGTGRIANRFVLASETVQGLKVNAVYNPHPGSAEAFAANHKLAHAYSDFGLFLDEVDAVYIATPHETHKEYVSKALDAEKHVLCEKPMCFSKKDAESLFLKAKEKQLVLMEGFKTAYCPGFQLIMEQIRTGKIGEVVDISAAFSRIPENMAGLREVENREYGGSFTEYGSYTLLPIAMLFGCNPKEMRFSSILNSNGTDCFTKVDLAFDKGFAEGRTGLGVKTEGQLVVSGTKGYLLAPSPWWLTKYFEIRHEDPNDTERFETNFDGSGLRYEMEEFLMQISGTRPTNKEMQNVSIFAAEIMEEFLKKRMSQNGI